MVALTLKRKVLFCAHLSFVDFLMDVFCSFSASLFLPFQFDYKPYTYWLLTAKPTNHRPTCSSQASSMRAHSHSTGASGPRRKRRASSASRLLPCDSRNRGVSGMKHMQTISSVGGMEAQIASQRQSTKRPAR